MAITATEPMAHSNPAANAAPAVNVATVEAVANVVNAATGHPALGKPRKTRWQYPLHPPCPLTL